jgi:hypothetical protein
MFYINTLLPLVYSLRYLRLNIQGKSLILFCFGPPFLRWTSGSLNKMLSNASYIYIFGLFHTDKKNFRYNDNPIKEIIKNLFLLCFKKVKTLGFVFCKTKPQISVWLIRGLRVTFNEITYWNYIEYFIEKNPIYNNQNNLPQRQRWLPVRKIWETASFCKRFWWVYSNLIKKRSFFYTRFIFYIDNRVFYRFKEKTIFQNVFVTRLLGLLLTKINCNRSMKMPRVYH